MAEQQRRFLKVFFFKCNSIVLAWEKEHAFQLREPHMCEICLDVCSCAQQGGRGSWQLCYWPGLQAAPSLHWPIHHCCLDTRSSSGSSKSLRWEPLKLCRCSMRRPSSAPARHPNCFSISQAACCFSSFVVWWKCNLNLLPSLLKCLEEFVDIEVKPIRIHLLKSIISHCYKCHVNNNKKKLKNY